MVAAKTRAQIFWFSNTRRIKQGAFTHVDGIYFIPSEGAAPEPVLPLSAIQLRGAHNVENVLAAVAAARLAGISAATIRQAVETFHAVDHRLQFIAKINGVDYFNDSKATNVDATAKALEAFPGNIRLILGGKDKGSDYTALLPLLTTRTRAIYTIGTAAQKIEDQLVEHLPYPITHAETLSNAVALAAREAQPGDTVLLAPACASFDQFTSYEHRGQAFATLVHALPTA